MDNNTDFIASELLKELKEGNARKDEQIAVMQRHYMYTICGFLIAILVIIAGFLIYLNQYDFSDSTEKSYTATGVYALVDSDGNVIAEDLTPDDITQIMEVLDTNGNSQSDNQNDKVEDSQ